MGQYNRHPITAFWSTVGCPKSTPLGQKHKILECPAPDCLFRTTDLANMRTHTKVVHLKAAKPYQYHYCVVERFMFKCRLDEHIKKVITNKTVECDAFEPPRSVIVPKELVKT